MFRITIKDGSGKFLALFQPWQDRVRGDSRLAWTLRRGTGLLVLALLFGGSEAQAGRDEAHAQIEQTRVALRLAMKYIKNDKFKASKRALRVADDHMALALYEARDVPATREPANDCAILVTAPGFGYKQLTDIQTMPAEERAHNLDLLQRAVRGMIKKMVLCDRVIDR